VKGRCTILQRDHDTKYGQAFDEVFTSEVLSIKKTPVKSPNLQAFVERVIQTLKHEVLNGFCVINERHLDYILKLGTDWYNHRRCHTARDHLPPVRDCEEPPTIDLARNKLVCVEALGGQLKSHRAAA
jgi:putative transposase